MAATRTTTSDLLALLRDVELKRLDEAGHVYLDYTGAAPYPESLLREHYALLRRRTLGNPHSSNPASRSSTEDIEGAKAHILQYFDAAPDEYDIALTANASAALRLVGESFAWQEGAWLALTADNHNSVNGIRELARARGARVAYLPLDAELRAQPAIELPDPDGAPALLAFPAQSNFSGVRHPFSWIADAHARGYHVLLDAAAFVPTGRLSLRDAPADFVAISFYKMFGYPSGIGALIARRCAVAKLARPAFAGGTVEYVRVARDEYRFKPDLASFEDGTVNFLAVSAIPLGLSFLGRIGSRRISAHVEQLTELLLSELAALRCRNGRPLVSLYGPRDTRERGGTVAFNVLDRDGQLIDCDRVVAAAADERISLRGGCFCNPGATERALETDEPRTGAVRASLGYGSNSHDIDSLITFLQGQFL